MPVPGPNMPMPQAQAPNSYGAPPSMMPQPSPGYPTSGPLSFGVSNRNLFVVVEGDSCISRTFLLKFWVKNCRTCGLYTRPLI